MEAKITALDKQEIIRLYVAGHSAIDIANRFGITRQRVHVLVNRAGVKRIRILEPGGASAKLAR